MNFIKYSFELNYRCQIDFQIWFQEDYKLLEEMNRATIAKYAEMKETAANIAKSTSELNAQCEYFSNPIYKEISNIIISICV